MKRYSLFLLVGILLVASATYTAASGNKEATTAGPSGVVNLTYFERNNDPINWAEFNWEVNTFNQQNAGKIHVTLSGIDGVTFRTKAPIELQSGNPPDIFFAWEGGWAQKMVSSGFAAPLDDYYAKYGWASFVNPAGVTLATIDGHKYFLPTQMSGSFVWYRPDIFAQYNIQVPTTWDEFLQVCDTLKTNGVIPLMIADQAKWPAQFEWTAIYVNKYGLAKYDELLHNKIPWTDPSVVDAFNVLRDLVTKGYVWPGYNSTDIDPGNIPFSQGKVAMWYQGTWMISTFLGNNKTLPFSVGFFPFPAFPGVKPTIEVFAENTLMIDSKSKYKDQAAEFLNWIISDQAQQHKINSQLPYAANTRVSLASLIPLAQQAGGTMAKAGQFTFMHVDHAFDPAIADTFLTQLQGVLSGAISGQTAAEATETTATQVRGAVK